MGKLLEVPNSCNIIIDVIGTFTFSRCIAIPFHWTWPISPIFVAVILVRRNGLATVCREDLIKCLLVVGNVCEIYTTLVIEWILQYAIQ